MNARSILKIGLVAGFLGMASVSLAVKNTWTYKTNMPTASRAAQQEPFTLEFATYMGGSGGENFRDVAVDSDGNIYVTGGTSSPDFPTTPGAYDRTFATGGSDLGSAGPMDIFVSKFSPSGQLIWSTYLCGPNYDRAYAIEVDAQSNVYLAGRAGPGFPTSPNVLQPNFAGDSGPAGAYGNQDGFVAKLSPDGSQLLWATYFGEAGGGIIRDLDVDSEGNIYVVSPGNSLGNHPHVSTGAYDVSHNGGLDAIVAKISPDARDVIWGTYLGGSLNDGGGPSVRVDPCSHAAYVVGNTSSTDFPTPNGYDRMLAGSANGNGEAFLAKLSADGAHLQWATFLGGSGDEGCGTHNLAIGPHGEVIAAHWTKSTDIPVLPGGFQTSHRGGTNDCIIWKFSPDGTLLANTYLGGNGDENIQGVAIDDNGNVYLSVDASTSTDLPTTTGAFQPGNGGGADGAFVVLSADLTRVLYATYLGGQGQDGSREAALGYDGSYVCAGDTASADFPLSNTFDSVLAGGNDGFVAKFVPTLPVVDLNGDGIVDLRDLSILFEYWLQNEPSVDIGPTPLGDGIVDFKDLAVFAEYWVEEILYIKWLGHASVKIWTEDAVVYVDPRNLSESPHDATLVLVTHTHSDHYQPADIARVSNDQTKFIAPPDVVQQYGQGQTIAPGQTIISSGVPVTAVAAYNINKTNHPKSNNWVGFIIELGGKRTYVAGDTDLIPEMQTLGKIDVAFLPAGGTYTMNATEAAQAANIINPTLAIPYHWGTIVGTLADAQTFAALARCAVKIMAVGETISSDNWPVYSPLIAHWELDEMEGSIAHDSAGDNNGTLHGEPLWQPSGGKIDGALQFDGTNDYVSTDFVLNPADGAFSVFVWIKGGGAGQAVISQTNGTGTGATWLGAESSQGKLMTGLVPPPSGRVATPPLVSQFVITDDQWYHIGLVWDGSRRHLYVDGTEVAADVGALAPLKTADGDMYIGAGKNIDAGSFFSGLIDDVRIYNQALDPEDIDALLH